jgi:hypothetical protein
MHIPISMPAMSAALCRAMEHEYLEIAKEKNVMDDDAFLAALVARCYPVFQHVWPEGVVLLPENFVWPDGMTNMFVPATARALKTAIDVSSVNNTERDDRGAAVIPEAISHDPETGIDDCKELGEVKEGNPPTAKNPLAERDGNTSPSACEKPLKKAILSVDDDPRFDVFRDNLAVLKLTERFYAEPRQKKEGEKDDEKPRGSYSSTLDGTCVTIIREFKAISNSNIEAGFFACEKATKRVYFVPHERTGRANWLALGQIHGNKKGKPFFATFIYPVGKEKTGKFRDYDVDMSEYRFDKKIGMLVRRSSIHDKYTPGNVPIVHNAASFQNPTVSIAPLCREDIKAPLSISEESVSVVREVMAQAAVDLSPAKRTVVKRTVNSLAKKKTGDPASKKRKRASKIGISVSFIDAEAQDDEEEEEEEDEKEEEEVEHESQAGSEAEEANESENGGDSD